MIYRAISYVRLILILIIITPAAQCLGSDSSSALRSKSGQVLVRFEMGSSGKEIYLSGRLKVKEAKISRIEKYFFEDSEDELWPAENAWRCRTTNRTYSTIPVGQQDLDVIVIWLDGACRDSKIEAEVNGEDFSFSIGQLLDKRQVLKQIDGAYISANLLFDNEVGEINPAEIGIKEKGEDFDFVIFTDTHAGKGNLKVNSNIAGNIDLVNTLTPGPDFLIVTGDIVTGKGRKRDYDTMLGLFDKLRLPVLFGVGNHETDYKCRFGPGYSMTAFENYFDAQKKINGTDKILYSFNHGKWHFVVWPDPLRHHFWGTHPHYFDWLDKDLRKNKDRPTMFFQHISLMPVGVNPMNNYTNKIAVRKMLLEILSRYGNVKYVFSGHTHATLKASFKTARTYRGIQFINLPATGKPSRNFGGEVDFDGQVSRGFALVSVRGDKAVVRYRMTEGRPRTYPDKLAEFRPDQYLLQLTEEWKLPAGEGIVNGGFEDGLEGWAKGFVYREDKKPSEICRPDNKIKRSGKACLYMFSKKRGPAGSNGRTQTVNRLCQAVKVSRGARPILKAWYRLDSKSYRAGDDSGASIRVEGYNGSSRRLEMAYWVGRAFFRPRGLWGTKQDYFHFDITSRPDRWHKVLMNIEKDYNEAAGGKKFEELDLDRMVVTLGVWNLNQNLKEHKVRKDMKIGLYFDDIEICFEPGDIKMQSTVDGRPVRPKAEEEIEARWIMNGEVRGKK